MRWLVLVALFTSASLARADNIVVESYTGDRPADAQRLMSPILDELAARGYAGGDTIGRKFDALSRPSSAAIPPDFVARAEQAHKAWVNGSFEDALRIVGPLIETAHASPVAVSEDQSLREALQRALVAAALSQLRSGDQSGAHATFAELVRAFPDVAVTRGQYGEEGSTFFAQVQRDLAGGGHGTLTVKLSDDGGSVFVDERYIGSAIPDLAPGEYRVFAKAGKQVSRVHRVVVRANDKAAIAIDIGFDAAVRTSPWVGLGFATSAEREAHEGMYAASFAKVLGAGAVIVIGIEPVRGRASIVGSLVSLENGREIRRASVPIDPDPSTEKLRALARYVAGDPPSTDIEVLATPEHQDVGSATTEPSSGHGWGGWKWIAGVGAAGALGTGAVLLALNNECVTPPTMAGRPCTDLRNTLGPGLAVAGAGVALAAVSVYLFVRKPSEPHGGTAYLAPTSGGAMLGYTRGF